MKSGHRTSLAKIVLVAATASAGFTAWVEIARADMLVLESTEPNYKTGARLPGTTLDAKSFAAGTHVRVLLLDTQTTMDFVGPPANLPIGGMRGLKRKSQQ